MPQWIDTTIGKVRIEKQLAKGGMAEVYLGTHITLERHVAVKVLHSYVEEDEEMKMRFHREAKVVAALRHPNIVQIFDFDTADGHPYIVMEYVRGPSLAMYLNHLHQRNERMQPQHVARLISKIANALDYAHGEGVIHRDIKPGNILLHAKVGSSRSMFTDQIEPIITDFGLVRIMHATTQTASGLVSGTPAYISPEQAQGLKTDHRTDIYSLGVVLYEILAGHVPFEADTNWTVIYQHIHEVPPPVPDVHPAIQKVIERALAKDPNDRYQTCRDLAMDYLNAIGMIAENSTMPYVTAADSVSLKQTRQAPSTSTENIQQPSTQAAAVHRNWLPIFGIGFLVLALGALGLSRLLGPKSMGQTPTAMEHSINVVGTPGQSVNSNSPSVNEPTPVGLLRFQDGTAFADQVTVTTTTMPQPPIGSQYEVWLVEDDAEQRVSIGLIRFDTEGRGSLSAVDPQGRNLLGMYHGMEITIEPNPDANPNPSNNVAYKVRLPTSGFMHVRHLLYSFGATPDQVGFIQGLTRDTHFINTIARDMLSTYQAGDEKKTREHAEAILNLIVGNQSTDYKDWDNDGVVNDPGDGFGLLLNGDNEGYIQGTFTHANLSLSSPDATGNMLVHGEHVKITATNIAGWTTTLRDQMILLVNAPFNSEMEGMIRNSVALANQIENGSDVNGNERIEPIPGEGGTNTAREHAYYMADMLIPAATTPSP